MPTSDPRHVITPDAFSVHPALVGLPLARPARRLAAMLLDLLIVAILVRAGGAALLGLAAAWFAFRAAGRFTGATTRPLGRVMRFGIRSFGALMLFIVVTSLWGRGADAVRSVLRPKVQVAAGSAGGQARLGPGEALGLGSTIVALQGTEDEDEARRLVGELAAGFRRSGMDEAEVEDALHELVDGGDARREAWLEGIVRSTLAPPPADTAAANPDSLARAYATALEAGDTAAAAALRPRVASVLARDSLDRLRREASRARERERATAARLEEVENRGLLGSLLHLLDDLGIGFGWTGLYFTAFVALWNGATPGKRLLGVRVVRLDGKPMTWWASFERFGGYAAGLVTGLLGFAQVYWDRNRQMIHDKIVETVVVRDRGEAPTPPPPAPPPAPRRPV